MVGRTLFRLALRAYPRRFRAQFGDSMRETFELRYRELGGRRAWRRIPLVAALAFSGLRERINPSLGRGAGYSMNEEGMMMRWMNTWLRDLRLAGRTLRKRPGFSLIAIVTVGLGIGAATTTFSVIDGVLLNPLPYAEPDGLVTVESNWSGEFSSMSYLDMVDLEAEADAIENLVGVATTRRTLTGLGDPEVLRGARVTEGLLGAFRLAPLMGRDLRADEFGPEGPRVAVISHGFWERRLGADPNVLGRTVRLDGVSYEIVGVAPPEMGFPRDVAFWVPWRGGPATGCGRGCHNIGVYGRLASDAAVPTAQAQADRVALLLEDEYPASNTNKGFRVRTLRDAMVGEVRSGLTILLGAVGLVLLIACVNVANLLLVRSSTRRREFAVRKALGAGRGRLLAQSLSESLVLAVLGGILGLVITAVTLSALPRFAAGAIPRLESVGIDGTVLLASLATVGLVTLLFGLAPGIMAAETEPRPGLNARNDDSRGSTRLRNWLLAGEVALSAVLLVGAGLLARSMQELYAVELGYETTNITRFRLDLPQSEYPEALDASRLFREVEASILSLPEVEAVGTMWSPPMGGGSAAGTVTVEGRPPSGPEDEVDAAVRPIGPGLLEVYGIEVLRGRGFVESDHDGTGESVAMINQRLADRLFPDGDPLGRVVQYGVSVGYPSPGSFRIVGILPDMRIGSITREPVSELWVPHGIYGPPGATVSVKTASEAQAVIPRIRELVSAIDPDLPIYRVETMRQALGNEVADTRFYLVLALSFAALAAALAAVGMYGVVAYAVSRRTREIGLRMALGADGRKVVRLVLTRGLRPALWGLVTGLIAALMGVRLLDAVVFGVEPLDPLTFGATAALLVLVALLANLVPARRATRVDPVEALGAE